MKSMPVIVGRIASVKAARVTHVRLDAWTTIIFAHKSNHEPSCSNQTICQKQPLEGTKRQHDEAHKIGKFLPEFPHNAPHWGLSDRMSEPTKATLSPQWRHPHPNRKKAEYQ